MIFYKDIGVLGTHSQVQKTWGGHLILCSPPSKRGGGGTCPSVCPQVTPMDDMSGNVR